MISHIPQWSEKIPTDRIENRYAANWIVRLIFFALSLCAISRRAGVDGLTITYIGEAIFLLLFFISCLAHGLKPHTFAATFAIFIILAAYYLFPSIEEGAAYLDYIKAVKPILNLPMIWLIVSHIKFDAKIIERQLVVFLCLVAAVYIISFGLGDPRPYFAFENNFEIPFFALIWLGATGSSMSKAPARIISFALIIIAATGKSRSGALCVSAVFLASLFDSYRSSKEYAPGRLIALILVALSALAATAYLFLSRLSTDGSESFEDVDRAQFFQAFSSTWNYYSPWGWAFGNGPLKELPVDICSGFSYYLSDLAGKNGECYSVIYHAFFLRFLYDFGTAGLIALVFGLYVCVRRQLNMRLTLSTLAIPMLAGLSVGGLYNALTAIGLVLCVGMQTKG